MAARIYELTLQTSIDVNAQTTGSQFFSGIDSTPSGGFTIIYEDSAPGDLRQVVFAGDGQTLIADRRIAEHNGAADIAALPDGGWAFAYTFGSQMLAAGFIAPSGSVERVQLSPFADALDPAIAANGSGTSLVVWQDRGSQFNAYRIDGQLFSAQGEALSPEISISAPFQSTQTQHWAPEVTALENSNFVVTWYTLNHSLRYAQYAVVGADGSILAGPQPVHHDEVSPWDPLGRDFPTVTALENGGFAISYQLSGTAYGVVPIVFFDETGTRTGMTGIASSSDRPVIRSISEDHVIVTTSIRDPITGLSSVYATHAAIDGSVTGQPILVAENVSFAEAAALVGSYGGDFALAYTEQSGGADLDVQADIYHLTLRHVGNGANDIMVATDLQDVFQGGEGLDSASYEESGAAVTVSLDGSLPIGGGHAFGDTFESVEGLRGSAFGDRLVGDAGSNFIYGSGGDDEIWGRASLDVLHGGAGSDFIDGGSEFDVVALRGLFAGGSTLYRFENFVFATDRADGSHDVIVNVESFGQLDSAGEFLHSVDLHEVPFFEAFRYAASHDDLAGAFGLDGAAAAQHFMRFGHAERREIDFDPAQYLANYPDLQAALGNDLNAATAHFLAHGVHENRLSEDPLAYVASYDDLIQAFGHLPADAVAAQALAHYHAHGHAEGRRAGIDFDAWDYLAANADVSAAFVTNFTDYDSQAVAFHYIRHGFAEHRLTVDPLDYIAANDDLVQAFAGDPNLVERAVNHFREVGWREDRDMDFDVDGYLSNYADLREAFHTFDGEYFEEAAVLYYITTGFFDGQTDELLPL